MIYLSKGLVMNFETAFKNGGRIYLREIITSVLTLVDESIQLRSHGLFAQATKKQKKIREGEFSITCKSLFVNFKFINKRIAFNNICNIIK